MAEPGRPTRLGPYAIVRPLGHGGMASVYEAVHIGLGKRVAIKVMQPHLASQATTSARFLREGRAVAMVRHAHVVDVFDVGAHEGVPYLVMELLEGTDLAEYLKCHTRLGLVETVDIMLAVCSAVAAAHDAGIVHRDLKPANVFLARARHGRVHPKVVDFGISTFMEKDGDLDLTQTQTMLGTVRYMSPEQTRGAKYADARSDQYSLGVMLYLCLTGRVPYTGEGVYETIHAIRNAELVPPSALNPALPRAFDAVVTRALERDPNARFASVAELGRALLAFATLRSSAGWEREFPPTDDLARTQPDPQPTAVQTAKEEPTAMTTVTQATRHRGARRWRAVIAASVAAAALAGLGAVVVVPRLGPQRAGDAAEQLSPSIAGWARAQHVDPARRAEARVATDAPPATPASSAVPSSGSPAKAAKGVAARPRRPGPAPAATGNNGAPILE